MKDSQMWEMRGLFFTVLAFLATGWLVWLYASMIVVCFVLVLLTSRAETLHSLRMSKLMLEHIARVEGIDLKNKEKADESAKSS